MNYIPRKIEKDTKDILVFRTIKELFLQNNKILRLTLLLCDEPVA